MREDMAKIIVERPRRKPWNSRKGRPQEIESLPAHEGMRRGHALRGERKELNENLAPLRRYLAGQVGRPWRKVYSEIATHLRVDSTVQQHVRDHLRDYVAVAPRRNIHDWRTTIRGGVWWQEFYVDPATDLLCRTDQMPEEKARRRTKMKRPSPAVERVTLADDRELRLIDGLWYELRLAPLPDPIYCANRETVTLRLKGRYSRRGPSVEVEMNLRRLVSSPVRDVATGAMIEIGPAIDDPDRWKDYRRVQPDRHYAVAKRVLSRRELRRHGLSNPHSACGGICSAKSIPS